MRGLGLTPPAPQHSRSGSSPPHQPSFLPEPLYTFFSHHTSLRSRASRKKKKSDFFSEVAFMEMRGLEPLTSCMPCKRSSQMSYTPKRFHQYILDCFFCQAENEENHPLISSSTWERSSPVKSAISSAALPRAISFLAISNLFW